MVEIGENEACAWKRGTTLTLVLPSFFSSSCVAYGEWRGRTIYIYRTNTKEEREYDENINGGNSSSSSNSSSSTIQGHSKHDFISIFS